MAGQDNITHEERILQNYNPTYDEKKDVVELLKNHAQTMVELANAVGGKSVDVESTVLYIRRVCSAIVGDLVKANLDEFNK